MPQQPPPIHFQYHAAAIALNNTGVSILERGGSPRDAVDVIKESVGLMKMVSATMTHSTEQGLPPSQDEVKQLEQAWPNVQELLRRASHSLFHPVPSDELNAAQSTITPSSQLNDGSQVKVVTMDDCAATVHELLTAQQQANEKEESSSQPGLSKKKARTTLLIRIESSLAGANGGSLLGSGAARTSPLFDVDSSIILYNFGAAFECVASFTDCCWSKEEEFHKSAQRLSELSFTIFRDNVWPGRHHPISDDQQQHGQQMMTMMNSDYLPILILYLLNLVELTSRTMITPARRLNMWEWSSSSSFEDRMSISHQQQQQHHHHQAYRQQLLQASDIFLQNQVFLANVTRCGPAPAA